MMTAEMTRDLDWEAYGTGWMAVVKVAPWPWYTASLWEVDDGSFLVRLIGEGDDYFEELDVGWWSTLERAKLAVEALVVQLQGARDFGPRRAAWRDDFDRVTVIRLRVQVETIDAAVAPLVEEAG